MTDLKIFSNLKFIGYKQTAGPGRNGQYLIYKNGVADWSQTNITTSTSTNTVITDRAGNVVIANNEIYNDLDIAPIREEKSNIKAIDTSAKLVPEHIEGNIVFISGASVKSGSDTLTQDKWHGYTGSKWVLFTTTSI